MHRLGIKILCCCVASMMFLMTGCGGPEKPDRETTPVVKKIIPKQKPAANKTAKDAAKAAGDAAVKKDGPAQGADEDMAAQPSEDNPALELYNPTGKIDPFAPLFREEQVVSTEKSTSAKKRRRAHLTPLEKVDLSQLKLLGTILAPSGNRAMVADSGGKGYVVTIGTYIGISSGRVVDILKDRIVVEEEVENLLGKISLRKRELTIPKPLGE